MWNTNTSDSTSGIIDTNVCMNADWIEENITDGQKFMLFGHPHCTANGKSASLM
jgi:hypothetical protein